MSRFSFDAASSPPSPQRSSQFMPISPDRTPTTATAPRPSGMTILERAAAAKPSIPALNLHALARTESPSTSTTTTGDDPRKFSVTNLDTGESFRIDHVPSVLAVEETLDTFLTSDEAGDDADELMEVALNGAQSDITAAATRTAPSPLSALYSSQENQLMDDIADQRKDQAHATNATNDANDSWLNSATNPLSDQEDDDEDEGIAEHRKIVRQHNDPVAKFSQILADAKSPHRSATARKTLPPDHSNSSNSSTTTTNSGGGGLLNSHVSSPPRTTSSRRGRTSSGHGPVAALPRVTIEGTFYCTCWLYMLCNFQYRQHYENTCLDHFDC
jgi:hypothetical protein